MLGKCWPGFCVNGSCWLGMYHPCKHDTSAQCWPTVYDSGPTLGRCAVFAWMGLFFHICIYLKTNKRIRRWPNVFLMLRPRRRRWTNIKTTPGQNQDMLCFRLVCDAWMGMGFEPVSLQYFTLHTKQFDNFQIHFIWGLNGKPNSKRLTPHPPSYLPCFTFSTCINRC